MASKLPEIRFATGNAAAARPSASILEGFVPLGGHWNAERLGRDTEATHSRGLSDMSWSSSEGTDSDDDELGPVQLSNGSRSPATGKARLSGRGRRAGPAKDGSSWPMGAAPHRRGREVGGPHARTKAAPLVRRESRMRIEAALSGKNHYLVVAMSANRAIPRPVRRLAENLSMSSIDISHRALDADACVAVAECLTINGSITDLNLSDNRAGDKGGLAFCKALASNTALTSLNLANNTLGRRTAASLAEVLPQSTQLAKLNLAGNPLTDLFVKRMQQKLDSHPFSPALAVLDLSATGLTSAAAPPLAAVLKASRLTQLNLDWNEIGDGVNHLFAALFGDGAPQQPQLTKLSIAFNGLRDTVADALSAMLHGNTTLTDINLASNHLTSVTGSAIATVLPQNASLLRLKLSFNNLGLETTENLIRAALLDSTRFEDLCLENTLGADVGPTGDAMIQSVWELASECNEKRKRQAAFTLEYPPRMRWHRPRDESGNVIEEVDPIVFGSGEWSLQSSVFGDRRMETDSRDYLDTLKLMNRAFDADWSKSKLERLFKDPEERAAVKEVLRDNYVPLREIFRYYASTGTDPFVMTFTQWTEFRKDMGMDDLHLGPDLDNVFVATDYEFEKDDDNPDRAFMRFELMEAVVRAAHIVNPPKSYAQLGGVESVRATMDELVVPAIMHLMGMKDKYDIVSNAFRTERLYQESTDRVLAEYIDELRAVYKAHSGRFSKPGDKSQFMSLEEWMDLLHHSGLMKTGLTERVAQLIFLYGNMTVVDEHRRSYALSMRDHCNVLTFFEFVECVARLADTVACPKPRGTGFALGLDALSSALVEDGGAGDAMRAKVDEQSAIDERNKRQLAEQERKQRVEARAAGGAGGLPGGSAEDSSRAADSPAQPKRGKSMGVLLRLKSKARAISRNHAGYHKFPASFDTTQYATGCGNPDLCVDVDEPLANKLPRMIELVCRGRAARNPSQHGTGLRVDARGASPAT